MYIQHYSVYVVIIIIIGQPYCPVVGQMPHQAVSKLACIVLYTVRSCSSNICPGRLSTAWLVSLSSFLVTWCQSGDTRGPSVVFEAVDMPSPGPFHLSHIAYYIDDFFPLLDPYVGLSNPVLDVEHTTFHFGLCVRKYVLCLFGKCTCLCTICHSWQHTRVVHLSLQADGMVGFEDIQMFGI